MTTTARCPSADALARRLAEAWARGERPTAADLLAAHPALSDDDIAYLLFEEVGLRQDAGEADAVARVAAAHPAWASRLELLCGALDPSPARFKAGDTFAACRLVEPLGEGAAGQVFLAEQPDLADRPVVLKIAAAHGDEYRTLARLQHAHIVPLLAAPTDRGLRGIFMPDLGGLALDRALNALRPFPPRHRTGRHLLAVLAAARGGDARGPYRRFLDHASYEHAVCWIGACLADALHHAHRRGFLHLDIKPANVLLAANGTPMLLDFHLARGPVFAGDPPPPWLGGSDGYMPPEQRAALGSVRTRTPITRDVDGRADLYALAATLVELLAGAMPPGGPSVRALAVTNPAVSVALRDVLTRCLSPDPTKRYPDAATLAADLRAHMANRPLCGVANRSVVERWRKWRRRQPAALSVVLLGTLVAVGAAAVWQTDRLAAAQRQPVAAARPAVSPPPAITAVADAEAVIARRPDDFAAQFAAGVERLRRGDAGAALARFHACVALAPTRPECFYNRGLAHAARGDLPAAEADYTRALDLPSPPAGAALNRGQARLVRGDAEGALADFALAETLGADPGDARYNAALAHQAAGRLADARRCAAAAGDHAAARDLYAALRP